MTMGKSSELKKINFPISEVISQIQVLVKQQLLLKNIAVEHTGEPDLRVYADPEQMKLVFLNLFVNAMQPYPNKGKSGVHSELETKKRLARFTVSDNGTGIKPDDLDRVSKSRIFPRKPDGTGLGLALVKRIIDRHNGSISAANGETGGAKFEIVLPLED